MKDYKGSYGSLVVGDWPNTVAKNASGPSASDGTPFTKELIDDIWGGRVDLMVRAGLTPDGVTEANGASQFVQALHRAGLGPGIIVQSALNAATLATRRYLPIAGQVITVASYPELVAAVYCGDAANPTAPGFYRTSDAGGATRSTTGAYMVLPDARGLVIRGLGANTKIFCSNGNSYSGGEAIAEQLTDMMFGHRHSFGIGGGFAAYAASNGPINYLVGNNGSNYGTTATLQAQGYIGGSTTDTVNGTPRPGPETRGASIAFQICITY